jgi:hypothetical protein
MAKHAAAPGAGLGHAGRVAVTWAVPAVAAWKNPAVMPQLQTSLPVGRRAQRRAVRGDGRPLGVRRAVQVHLDQRAEGDAQAATRVEFADAHLTRPAGRGRRRPLPVPVLGVRSPQVAEAA